MLCVKALHNLHFSLRNQGLQIYLLPINSLKIMRKRFYWRGKVLDGQQFNVFFQQSPRQRPQVKPLVWRTFQQTVVKVVPVYVNYRLHNAKTPTRRSGSRSASTESHGLMQVLSHILLELTRGIFKKSLNLVIFSRSQIHSYAYHLVSVRRHNQHVRSPIQGFFGARESASSPALNKDRRSHGFRPKNTRIKSLPTAPRQSPRPSKLARGVGHSVPKRKFRTGCKSGADSSLRPYICSEQIYKHLCR